MLTAELWQAVALSFDIEPRSMPTLVSRQEGTKYRFDRESGRIIRPLAPFEYWDRLEIACNHARQGKLHAAGAGNPEWARAEVTLSEFGTWATGAGWDLPAAFPVDLPADPKQAEPEAAPPASPGVSGVEVEPVTEVQGGDVVQQPATVGAETKARQGLEALMKAGPKTKAKARYRDEYGIGRRAFDRAWAMALEDSQDPNGWGAPGRMKRVG